MRIEARSAASLVFLATTLLLGACTQQMGKQGHLRPLEGDPALMRLTRRPPEGTVPRTSQAQLQAGPPRPWTAEILARGREQYGVFCLPCHGPSGQGNGMIVQRGFLAPPSYHEERLRQAPDQHFFDVITQGYGAMYSYADRVPVSDRWAIVSYIRALQLSQNARWDQLSPEDQTKLREGGHP